MNKKVLIILNTTNSKEDEQRIKELTKDYDFFDTKVFKNINKSDKNFLNKVDEDLKKYYEDIKSDFLILNANVDLDNDVINDLYNSKATTLMLLEDDNGELEIDEKTYKTLNCFYFKKEDIDKYINDNKTFLNFLEDIDIDIIVGNYKNKDTLSKDKAEKLIKKLLDSKFIDKKTAKRFISEKYYENFYNNQTDGQLLSNIWIYIIDNQMLPAKYLFLNKPNKSLLYKDLDYKDQLIFEQEILNRYQDFLKEKEDNNNLKSNKIIYILAIILMYTITIPSNSILVILINTYLIAKLMKAYKEK